MIVRKMETGKYVIMSKFGTFMIAMVLFFPLFSIQTVSGEDASAHWWNEEWGNRIEVWVNETNGIHQDEFIMDLWVDFSKYTVGNATREVRVTHWLEETSQEEEVSIQIVNDRNNGERTFEARVLFNVFYLNPHENCSYYIYFNNPNVSEPSTFYTDFNPDIIKNRISEPSFENNNHEFRGSSDVEVDNNGNIYVCDRENNRIQVFDENLIHLRTFGTTRESGNDTCHFDHPSGIAVCDDYLYVADEGNHRVQIFNLNGGFITTLGVTEDPGAGMGQFDHPKDVAVDSDGNVYVTDYNNHRVQVFNNLDDSIADDTIGAGISGNTNDRFGYPMGITYASGRLYVADSGNHRVQILDTQGIWQSTMGTGLMGSSNENFYYPYGVSVADDGGIAVADYGNHRVQLFSQDGTYERTLGVTMELGSGTSHLRAPHNVAQSNGMVYIADYGNDRIQVFHDDGTCIHALGGRSPYAIGDKDLSDVRSVEVDVDGNVYVGDRGNHRIQVFDSSGEFKFTIGTTQESGEANTHLNKPNDVLVKNDMILIADRLNNRVQISDANGTYMATIGGTGGQGDYQLNGPCGLDMDDDGYIFICDTYNNRVQVFNPDYTYNTTLGTGVGDWTNETFRHPYDIEFDDDGMIYILDTDNFRIQVFHPDNYTYSHTLLEGIREVTVDGPIGGGNGDNQLQWACGFDIRGNRIVIADTYNSRVKVMDIDGNYLFTIGVTGVPGSDNNHFARPRKVDISLNGDINVADADNNRIQVFDSDGNYLRTIGFSDRYTFDNSHLYNPAKVTADDSGNIYVVDTNNHRVQIFSRTGEYLDTIGSSTIREAGSDNGHLFVPRGITIANDQIYVADSGNARVQVFSMEGNYRETIDEDCYSVESDQQGNIYFVNSPSHCIFIKTEEGQLIQTLGVPNIAGSDDTHMNFPQGMGVDENGKIYVADSSNHRILVFDDLSDNVADHIIGITQEAGSDIAHFNQPTDVDCFDDLIYITDHTNHRIQIFNAQGNNFAFVDNIGVTGISGTDNTHLKSPTQTYIGPDGIIYISDMENGRIVKITDVQAIAQSAEDYDASIYDNIPWMYAIFPIIAVAIIVMVLALKRRTPGIPKRREKGLPVNKGYSYLINEKKPIKTFEISSQLAKLETYSILMIVRTSPNNLEEDYGIQAKKILWLSRVESDRESVESIKPSPLTKPLAKILSFMEDNKNPVIILEGIEHLISENGYSDVMRFLDSIVPVVATSKGILIVPVDEHTLSLQDYSLMARQMKMLE